MAAQTKPQTYYSRRDPQGATWPIKVWEDKPGRRRFEVDQGPLKGTQSFTTVKATLKHLHGSAYQTWGWDRYLGTGRYSQQVIGDPGLTIVSVTRKPLSPRLQTVVIAPGPRRTRPIGIDLDARHQEVAKLLYAGFGTQIYANGYDFEDILQEVFRKLIVSNQGKSPWDPSKSSFGHYVHMVCRSALYNVYRKDKRRKQHEMLGGRTYNSAGEWAPSDVADRRDLADPSTAPWSSKEAMEALIDHLWQAAEPGQWDDAELAEQLLPLVREGYTRAELAKHFGIKPAVISKGLAYLRSAARTWLH